MSLKIYYSELVQFKIAYPIANVKFLELKKVCIERLNKFSKLVKTNYGGIPDSFDEESYCLQDSANAFFDDGDIVSDLVQANDTIKLVYLPNLLKTNQPPPVQQQQVQNPIPPTPPVAQLNQPSTSLPTFHASPPPGSLQAYNSAWISKLVSNVKGIGGTQPLQQQQQPVIDQYKNEEEIEQLKQQFYLDVQQLSNVQQIGDFSFQIQFLQAQDSKKKYEFRCNLHDTLHELSQKVCKSLGLSEEHSICLYSKSGLPLYSCLNLMYTKTIEETLNKLINKEFGVIITKCSFGDKPLPKIDSAEGPQQIFVLQQGSKVVNVDLQTTTVMELKQKIFHKFEIPTTLQMLVYGGKYLDDAKILSEYGIQANSNVYLTFKTTEVQPYQSSYNYNFYTPWIQHIVPQSAAGLRQFRCSSLVFFAHLKEPNILAVLRKISNDNSSLILSIAQLMRKLKQSQLHCIAFEFGMLRLFFELMLSSKKILKTFKIDMIFEFSRFFYNWIKQQDRYRLEDMQEIVKQENYRSLDLVSQITLKPIQNPALLSQKQTDDEQTPQDWQLVDFDEIQNKIQNNEQHVSKIAYSELKLVQPNWLLEEFRIVSFLNRETLIWAPKQLLDTNDYVLDVQSDWNLNVVHTTHICTKTFSGTELKTQPETPCLTNGADKQLIIYVGANKDVKKPINVFNPISGMEVSANPDDLALQQFRGMTGNNDNDEDGSQSENEEQLKQPPQITQPPDEAIVVLFDISGSMDELFYESEDLTRMGVVKAFFNAFADRTMAYNLKNVISLVFFDDRYIQKCSFTELFILFKELVNKAKPQGATLLYTALQKAQQSLLELRKTYPNCILRIIALTDGEDNSKYGVAPILVAETIKKNDIILDSFVVNDQCYGLKKITKATGGQCFCPKTLQEGLKLFEYETILSAKIRKEKPKVTLKFLRDTFKLRNDEIQFDDKPVDILLPNEMQQQSIHPNALVQEISSDQNKLHHYAPNNSLKRVIKEIMNYEQHPHPYIKIFPCQTNVSFWKIILLGPEQTPYAQGVYILFLKFDADYPIKPPELRFLTQIYHCNINSQGRICHSILSRNYTPDTTVLQIFEAIYGLLMTPEPDDPLDTTIASEYLQDLQMYQTKAKQHTEANAKKPLDEVIKQIVGNQDIKVVNDEELQSKIQEINNWINQQQQPQQ